MYKVAPSYQKAKIVKIDEENKKALISETCDRCGGSGAYIIPPLFSGTCFKCNGAGKIAKWVKAYTDEEYEKYLITQEKNKERKRLKEEERIKELENNSEINKKELLEKWGYDPEDPIVYIVTGEDTYAIKNELKDAGCRFNPALGWYSNHEIEVRKGYILVPIKLDNLFDWFPRTKRLEIKENAKEVADAAIQKALPKSNSEYIGDIKERLRDLRVVLTSFRSFDGFYGTTFIYTFKKEDDVLIWMTSSCKEIEIGDELLLTGTVKEHSEYKGVKQTKLSRCIIKPV